jgi:hypothetical protein
MIRILTWTYRLIRRVVMAAALLRVLTVYRFVYANRHPEEAVVLAGLFFRRTAVLE